MSQVCSVRVDQCVSAVRAVEVPVSVCLRSGCNHVTEVGGGVRFVRLALKFGMQNDRDFVRVTLIYDMQNLSRLTKVEES